ncbi:MAG: YajQ family cyclic di-GMP-binding protein [Deltaproteobacteria bacterium RIFCSPLOWO2_02_FULL_44_10]|nr:MAG: YajQ family cyclic di-GMP-binding protein [Deltaproteobacteria bacterium RIFCSPHIGHO2_02_FULL_44_16]OGQ46313.1 MAG: YajQ family cyclic di-GMP-binding protein [Deltaproteobacteria bacterium RIFCSPLOWO2_02_FULL_44_10]
MPSFDIVSELNLQEMDNAINQATKELVTRYDFRGSKSKIEWDKKILKLIADDDFRMKAIIDIVQSKIVKRNIDIRSLEFGKIEPGADGMVKCEVKLKQGVPTEKAKEMVKDIKTTKLSVQAQIQENQVRVSGKKRDDLQQVIAFVRSKNYELPLQFINFRD